MLLVNEDEIWEARRREREQLYVQAVSILRSRPRKMGARELARAIAPGREERVARVLGWALRDRDDVLQWPPNGHGSRYAHRDWSPVLGVPPSLTQDALRPAPSSG